MRWRQPGWAFGFAMMFFVVPYQLAGASAWSLYSGFRLSHERNGLTVGPWVCRGFSR